jgi:hypothetical protein
VVSSRGNCKTHPRLLRRHLCRNQVILAQTWSHLHCLIGRLLIDSSVLGDLTSRCLLALCDLFVLLMYYQKITDCYRQICSASRFLVYSWLSVADFCFLNWLSLSCKDC